MRSIFQDQPDVVEKHWSGALNAPGNRPDEGVERFSHDLIEWEMLPTYDGSIVRFRGALIADAQLSRSRLYRAREGGYSNFSLSAATEYELLGSILPRLGGGWTWNLDNPGDTVATVYRLEGRKFRVEFRFPEGLEGGPSDYVVIVWGFRDFSRTPTINDSVDVLGYARIRVE